MNSKPANNTLLPGVYCGGLTIGNTNGTAFTLSPGVYIMAGGGLMLNSQAVVTWHRRHCIQHIERGVGLLQQV